MCDHSTPLCLSVCLSRVYRLHGDASAFPSAANLRAVLLQQIILALRRNRRLRLREPVPHRHQALQIMPEIGQLMYPNTRSRAKHIYTEEEVRMRAAG